MKLKNRSKLQQVKWNLLYFIREKLKLKHLVYEKQFFEGSAVWYIDIESFSYIMHWQASL